jgi:hypothetical protein
MSIEVALVEQAKSDLESARANLSRLACCLHHLHQCWKKAFKADFLSAVRQILWSVEPAKEHFDNVLKAHGHYLPLQATCARVYIERFLAQLHVPLPGMMGAYQQVDSNALVLARATSDFFRALDQNSLRYPVHLPTVGWVAPGSIPNATPKIEVDFLPGGEWFRAISAHSSPIMLQGVQPALSMKKIDDEVDTYLCDVEQRVKSP